MTVDLRAWDRARAVGAVEEAEHPRPALLALGFLAHTASGDARDVLDDLGVIRHRTHVLAIIERR